MMTGDDGRKTPTVPTGHGHGHGKVILAGEHAVVYGHPAVAAGLSVGIACRARPGSGRLRVPAWDLEAAAGDDSPVGRALSAIGRRLEAPDRRQRAPDGTVVAGRRLEIPGGHA